MNILFITYGGGRSNSLNHITVFFEGLVALGHDCCVAIPHGLAGRDSIPQAGLTVRLHEAPARRPSPFMNGRDADIIHAWTPRHGVLQSLLAYQRSIAVPARIIVHLEDNEQHVLASTAGTPVEDLIKWSDRKLKKLLKKGLAHPLRHELLLAAADLVSVITSQLTYFVPPGTPSAHLHPGTAPCFFSQALPDPDLRLKLGISTQDRIIAYPGGANLTNSEELRSLYSAVALLNKRGQSVKLIRTGPPTPWFTATLTSEEQACAIELGFVERSVIPQLLALADVLVQPGRPGPFNDYRLPSKIPEFLASGRPVVLPATNIALQMINGQEAVFLTQGNPEDIANCCERIFKDPVLAQKLGIAGKAFAEKHFDAAVNCKLLETLYMEALARPPAADWSRIRRWGHDEADLFPLASGRTTPENILELAKRRRNRWQHRIGELFSLIP